MLVIAAPSLTSEEVRPFRFQAWARRFADKIQKVKPEQFGKWQQLNVLVPGEGRRFGSNISKQDAAAGAAASAKNQAYLFDAIVRAARVAGPGGQVVVVGHGAQTGLGSEAVFEMGAGNTVFYMHSTEVHAGSFDSFLGMVGGALRHYKIGSIRFASCTLGRNPELVQRLANKTGVRVETDVNNLVFGEDGGGVYSKRVGGPGMKELDRVYNDLLPPETFAVPQRLPQSDVDEIFYVR